MKRLAIVVALGGCTALADFPEDRLTEATEALCGNHVDDDADGLMDCQDWGCLDREVCCTQPEVVLDDVFASTTCALPDDERWQAWGAPYPQVCDGALVIGKDELCYPVGVVSRAKVLLRPGLLLEATVSGTPEVAAHLAIGLTTSPFVIDGVEPCSYISPFATLFGVVTVADPAGVRFVATVEDRDLAAVLLPEDTHRIVIRVEDDRTVSFSVDGDVFASTSDAVPANTPTEAQVFVRGLGSVARVEDLRVVAGTQCDRPEAWTAVTPFAPVDPPAGTSPWDGFARGFPSARLDGDTIRLAYAGCRASVSPICDPFTYATGEAIAPRGESLQRPDAQLFLAGELDNTSVLDVQLLDGEAYWGRVDPIDHMSRTDLGASGLPTGAVEVIGGTDGWDPLVTNPQVMDVTDDQRLLWYTGRQTLDGPSWIAVASSTSGAPFVPEATRAVDVGVGEDQEYGDHGVREPAVIFDATRGLYRMWYTAIGSFGGTSIAYAVSTDGIHWEPYPGNPLFTAAELGLLLVSSPTVVDDGGRLRMWVHGTVTGDGSVTIYELENLGQPFGP